MNTRTQLRRKRRAKGGIYWTAVGRETLYCLFTCEACRTTNLTLTDAVFAVEKKRKENALAAMEQIRLGALEKLKTPGPKEGSLFLMSGFTCRCERCGTQPGWATAAREEGRKEAIAVFAWLAVLLSMHMLFLLIVSRMKSFNGNSPASVILFLNLAFWVGIAAIKSVMSDRAVRKIEDSIREYPILFGDSLEEVARQALTCGPYPGLTEEDLMKLLGTERK